MIKETTIKMVIVSKSEHSESDLSANSCENKYI